MTLPDWLVERAALDEVGAASRERIDRADPRELAARVAELRADNAAELGAHPAGPALALIDAGIAAETRRRSARRRRQRLSLLGIATSVAAVLVVVLAVGRAPSDHTQVVTRDDGIRVKGAARLLAFRQAGDQAERLDQDAVVRAGDLIQLRYNAGGRGYGVIASLDGAGVVTLHFPANEAAPTAVAPDTTTLANAYALDDAPRFERFFFITANEPIDVEHTLAALRALARRDDGATASLELPAGLHQWSLRLRKPDRQ